MIYGYARVSTTDQDTKLQIDALTGAGVHQKNIFQEKASGAKSDRPKLAECLNKLQAGDVLYVWKIDRVARSLRDLLHILERIQKRGATIKSLTEPLDTTSSMGMFVIQILGAVAQLERAIIRERSIAGQKAAIARGVKVGRRRSLTPDQEAEIVLSYSSGFYTMSDLARKNGVHLSSIKRCIHRHR